MELRYKPPRERVLRELVAGVHADAIVQGQKSTSGKAPKEWQGCWRGFYGGRKILSAKRKRAVHERAPAGLFPAEAAQLAGGHPQGGQRDPPALARRKPESSGPRRPRIFGDRPRDQTPRPGP